MYSLLGFLTIFVFWLGPPIFVLAGGALWFNARRQRPSGSPVPWHQFWSAAIVWGIAGAGIWIAAVALLLVVTRAGNAGLWFVVAPWAFAAGSAYGMHRLRRVLNA